MYFSEPNLSGILEKFSFTSKFLDSKMQKSAFLKKKKFLVRFFIELKCRWLRTGLTD